MTRRASPTPTDLHRRALLETIRVTRCTVASEMLCHRSDTQLGWSWALLSFPVTPGKVSPPLLFVGSGVSGPVMFCAAQCCRHTGGKDKHDATGLECRHVTNKLGLLLDKVPVAGSENQVCALGVTTGTSKGYFAWGFLAVV